jgi:nucleoside-diphosphate-sugar epimerase
MRVFITGGTGHSGPYITSELIAAGHEVTALARSDAAAATVSTLGANARRGDLADLDLLKATATQPDGVIHLGYRVELIGSGGLAAAISLGRPATEHDPAISSGPLGEGTPVSRNVVETTVLGFADHGVRASVVRIALIMHSPTDPSGFVSRLAALAKQKGFVAYPGTGANRWPAVHVAAGMRIHGVGKPVRIARAARRFSRRRHCLRNRGAAVDLRRFMECGRKRAGRLVAHRPQRTDERACLAPAVHPAGTGTQASRCDTARAGHAEAELAHLARVEHDQGTVVVRAAQPGLRADHGVGERFRHMACATVDLLIAALQQ